jgi:hypothetical protein
LISKYLQLRPLALAQRLRNTAELRGALPFLAAAASFPHLLRHVHRRFLTLANLFKPRMIGGLTRGSKTNGF